MRLLAIDGGGTKTVALLLNDHGRLLGWGRAGPSNVSFVSVEDATAAIQKAVMATAVMSGEELRRVDVAACGGPVLRSVMEPAVLAVTMPVTLLFPTEAQSCLACGGGA